ncbi:MAG: hypothetical protein A3F63_13480 [Pseudomonadales bacterium RIFCSPHIGHO2_12_FULL_40_16]|nr:MAG: hypothetical protein A3F63_13480 [Pseudomonadales bacterium RIFCSPHIGHO2_12_FULL_40_16]HLB41736.1 hypothetical protein [Gammaproteobacteria bacterium]
MNKLLCLGLILGCSNVYAANWKYLGSTQEYKIELDTDSIKKVPSGYASLGTSVTQFWIKRTVINDLTKDGLGIGDHSKMLFHVNCNADTLGFKTEVKYKGDRVIDSYTQPYITMEAIIPDSIGAGYALEVCNN